MAQSFRSNRDDSRKKRKHAHRSGTGEFLSWTGNRLWAEPLESRFAPSVTYTWSGLAPGGNTKWSSSLNWVGNVAPTGNPALQENLVFDSSASVRTSTNDLIFAGTTPTFSSITISAPGYTIGGQAIALGEPGISASGNIVVPSTALLTSAITLPMTLSNGTDSAFQIDAGAALTISGSLSSTPGTNLLKTNPGTLTLSADNSGFRGVVKLGNSGGTLVVGNANALGDTAAGTFIDQNSTLAFSSFFGPVNEPITVRGPGTNNLGALFGLGSNTILAGTITLDADTTIGAGAGNTLSITNTITDNGAGYNLVKDGPGEVILGSKTGNLPSYNGNTYRGSTTINDGTLTATHPLALGLPTVTNTVLVNKSLTKTGTLNLYDPTGAGFSVANRPLILNGPGVNGLGALANSKGNNTWFANVTLGSPSPNGSDVSIGAAANTTLTIQGVISNPLAVSPPITTQPFQLIKVDQGRLTLTNANTYIGTTYIQNGTVQITDSQGLGSGVGTTTVDAGATLELAVPFGGKNDSITNDPLRLSISERITINGMGVGNGGAIRNISGINTITSTLTMDNNALPTASGDYPLAAIGVDSDTRPGHPTPNETYLVSDYSLTITGNLTDTASNTRFPGSVAFLDRVQLVKRGLGNLILPTDNTYVGGTQIQQGWITIESNNSLGINATGTNPVNTSVFSASSQPSILISSGAALHLYPTGKTTSLNISRPITVDGTGISHPYSAISNRGAIVNLAGDNVISGDIRLMGQVGIDVEGVFNANSNLTITGNLYEKATPYFFKYVQVANPSTPAPEEAFLINTKSTSGKVVINYDFFGLPDSLKLYSPTRAQSGVAVYSSGLVTGQKTISVNYGPGSSSLVELVINEGGNNQSRATWAVNSIEVFPDSTNKGGIVKFGSKTLSIQGAGNYTGSNDIREGTLKLQNDSGLGTNTAPVSAKLVQTNQTTTTVEPGAILALSGSTAAQNGGIASGIQIYGEQLILNKPGVQVQISGEAQYLSGGSLIPNTFTLSYAGVSTTPININSSASVVQAALQAVLPVGGTVTVSQIPNMVGGTQYGGLYTFTFGGSLSGATTPNFSQFGAAATPGSTTRVVVSGGDAALVNLDNDNMWRGPVSFSQDSKINVVDQSRLDIFGVIDDTSNANPNGSAFVKQGNGALLLGGTNTFRGLLTVTQGVVTAMNNLAFGTTTNGVVVLNGAQIQIQGGLTIAGESLTMQGQGTTNTTTPNNVPVRWFNIGPSPINNAQTPGDTYVAGRMTGLAVDPSNDNVIYAVSAGGGLWKTVNAGQSWTPIFNTGATIANAQQSGIFGGAVAIAPSNPNVIYYGTGESEYSGDAFYGTGVYRSLDGGLTWTLMTNVDKSNPLQGLTVTKIVVDPSDPNTFYAATSDVGVNSNPVGAPGIYRMVVGTSDYLNLTSQAAISNVRATAPSQFTGNPVLNTPGPNDDDRMIFPQSAASWTDMALYPSGNGSTYTLYAALGTTIFNGTRFTSTITYLPGTNGPFPNNIVNTIYRTTNPKSNNPNWFVGDGNTYSRAGGMPNILSNYPRDNTSIRFTLFAPRDTVSTTNPTIGRLLAPPYTATYAPPVIYSVQAIGDFASANLYGLLDIQRSGDGGVTWAATNRPADYFNNQGDYSNEIIALDTNTVFIAGVGGTPFGAPTGPYISYDGGTSWNSVNADSTGVGPHADGQSVALDSLHRVIFGNDGGISRLEPGTATNPNGFSWTNLNGNLSTITFNGLDVSPTNPNVALAASQDNGTELFTGAKEWLHVDDGDGGVVQINPGNPLIAYHVLNGFIRRSTDGGLTWSFVSTTLPLTNGLYFDLVIDKINPNRILAGGNQTNLQESNNDSSTWTDLNAPIPADISIAPAQYQGPFVADTRFPLVTDKLSNTYDPDTIYVTDGNQIAVTKNHGLSWAVMNNPAGAGSITKIAVDPRNRDILYVTVSQPLGISGARVYRSTDAGQTFIAIDDTGSNGLPSIPISTIVIDPRNGNIYVGNDNGIYVTNDINLSGPTTTWTRFGSGMPQVQVTQLVLNQQLNTLTAATYGRGLFQMFLNDVAPNSGALRAISGNSVWTGPIHLNGDTTIEASGTQSLQNGISAATLNVLGIISDGSPAGGTLTKIGSGNLVLSGANNYTGLTVIQQGVIRANNATALGSTSSSTTVLTGAALELSNDLQGETVFLNGNGFLFNGHFLGAMRNFSGINTFTGTAVLSTNATIGVDSGTTLIIGSKIGLSGTGSITDNNSTKSITKEGTGTLILASANTYGGSTVVQQGALQVQDPNALGSTAVGTNVVDGAQLQLANNVTVTGEKLNLSGTGISNTGALLNVSGNNTWDGPIALSSIPNSFPTTTPPSNVGIGVANANDTLTVSGVISQSGGTFGLVKLLPGLLVLTTQNSYGGPTFINAGSLRIQDPAALGTSTAGATVAAGAALEYDSVPLQGGVMTVATNVTLNGSGNANSPAGALRNISGNNTQSGSVTLQSNTSIGTDAGTSLTVIGNVKDFSPISVPASSLRKVGAGTLLFPNPNTYSGKTFIDNGILDVSDSLALGNNLPEQQQIDIIATAGTFQIQFTAPVSYPAGSATTISLAYNETAANVQLQLNSIINSLIGVLNAVTVTRAPIGTSGFRYLVTFTGLPQSNIPPLAVTTTAGANAIVTTIQDGPEGTTVNAGGTLALEGSQTWSTELLTLNGNGFQGLGALRSISGNNIWNRIITLGSTSTIGVDAASSLAVQSTITDQGSNFSVIKNGQGTLAYNSPTSNNYGLTQVNDGILQLNATSTSIPGNLVIGDTTGTAGSAIVIEQSSNQMASSTVVTVQSDGVYNLNSQTDTVAGLNIIGGAVQTGAGAGSLSLNGNLTANSVQLINGVSGPYSATISGSTPVAILNGPRTFNITDGPANSDLIITAPLTGSGNNGFIKQGAGRLEIDSKNAGTLTAVTQIATGDLQVGGNLGPVSLTGGSLSGTGQVGTISDIGGTIAPGNNALANPVGTLTAGDTVLNAAASISVNLNKRFAITPVPGVDNDLFVVNGILNLNGVQLTGVVASNVILGDSFTIIRSTNPIIGKLAELPGNPNVTFVGGQKFTVDYSNPTQVTLTRVLAAAAFNITPSTPTAVYGQSLTFAITLTPESGGILPAGTTITVQFDGANYPVTMTVSGDGIGRVTFNPIVATGGPISVGTHTLSVNYLGDQSGPGSTNVQFSAASGTLTPNFNVTAASTTTVVTVDTTTPSFGQTLNATATVTATAPGSGTPSGQVIFRIDGVNQPPVTLVNGVATLPIVGLTIGQHTISAVYATSTNYNTSVSNDVQILATRAPTSLTLTNPTVVDYGSNVQFVATINITQGSGIPTGIVIFYNGPASGNNEIGRVDLLANGTATLQTNKLAPGNNQVITALYAGDGAFSSSSSTSTISVNRLSIGVGLTANPTSILSGDPVTLVATLAGPFGPNAPTGTVTFRRGDGLGGTIDIGTANIVSTSNGLQAIYVTSAGQLPFGNQSVTAAYSGDSNYLPANTNGSPVNITVNVAVPRVTTPAAPVSVNTTTTNIGGDNVDPGALIDVYLDANGNNVYDPGIDPLVATQQLTAPTTVFNVAVPLITNQSQEFFVTSSLNGITSAPIPTPVITQDSVAPTSTNLVASNPYLSTTNGTRPSATNFTAAISDSSPVSWTIQITNASNQIVRTFTGSGLSVNQTWDGKDASGNQVPDGVYTATMQYLDSAGNPGVATNTSVTVFNGSASIGLTNNSPTLFGSDATFVATLQVPFASIAGFLAGSSVDFFAGTLKLGTSTVAANSSGQYTATLSNNTLPAGQNTNITARLVAGPNFAAVTSAPVTQVVTPTSVLLSITSNSGILSDKPSVFTASLSGTAGAISQIPAGTLVSFQTGSTLLGTAPLVAAANGTLTATLSVSNLAAGTYPVTPNITLNSNFVISSSGPVNHVIAAAPQYIAVGSGVGFDPVVNIYNTDGSLKISLRAFTQQYTGGVRTAVGDFNGDGVPDVVVGTGPGTAAMIRVLDGNDPTKELLSFSPFETFTGGVFVATGDVNADGVPDIVITPDEGGGPRVRILSGKDFTQINDFFGIADPNFRGGARASVGDINGDGYGDVIVAAGFGGGPRVATLSGKSVANHDANPTQLFGDFFAFEQTLRNGTYVTVGDVNGDGIPDLIVGAGPGGGPRVTVFDGAALLKNQQSTVADFFAGDAESRGGVRVVYKTYRDGTKPDIVVGSGEGFGSLVKSYPVANVIGSSTPATRLDFEAFNDAAGGVYVG